VAPHASSRSSPRPHRCAGASAAGSLSPRSRCGRAEHGCTSELDRAYRRAVAPGPAAPSRPIIARSTAQRTTPRPCRPALDPSPPRLLARTAHHLRPMAHDLLATIVSGVRLVFGQYSSEPSTIHNHPSRKCRCSISGPSWQDHRVESLDPRIRGRRSASRWRTAGRFSVVHPGSDFAHQHVFVEGCDGLNVGCSTHSVRFRPCLTSWRAWACCGSQSLPGRQSLGSGLAAAAV
jgi:hypothetical protein